MRKRKDLAVGGLVLSAALALVGCAHDKTKPAETAETKPGEEQPAATAKPLAGKKVVMIIASQKFRDEELAEPKKILTERGAELMRQAVVNGKLDESALGVPYDNLATMHRRMGNPAQAADFAEMAKKVESSGEETKQR